MKTSQSSKLAPWIHAMVAMRARQGAIKRITGASSQTIRDSWAKINGMSSPSGLTPSDVEWYLKTPSLRYQSAFFLILYQAASRHHASQTAVAAAYYHFAHITSGEWASKTLVGAYRDDESDYVLPFSRAHYLSSLFTDARDKNGARFCSLEIKTCKKCLGKYLAHHIERSICPLCLHS